MSSQPGKSGRRRRTNDALTPRQGLAMADPLQQRPARAQGGIAYFMDALKVRPAGRRALSTLAVLLCLGGAGMFAYPLVTDVYASRVLQRSLSNEYDGLTEQKYVTRTVRIGDPLTRIIIPKLGVNAVVVAGTSLAALRAGAGHYSNTPLPGEQGNMAIAGHRTTYGKPFNRMDELVAGDKIRLETPLATYTYQVVPHPADVSGGCPNGACWITTPTDWGVIAPTTNPSLTLTSCHPKGSAAQRIILRSELVSTGPPPQTRTEVEDA